MSCVIDHKRRRSKEKEKEKEKNYWMQLTAYITARTSDCVSLQSNGSFTIKKAVVTISTVPKKYDNAVQKDLPDTSSKLAPGEFPLHAQSLVGDIRVCQNLTKESETIT